MIIRSEQQEFVDKALEALSKFNKTVIVAPTGAGKNALRAIIIVARYLDFYKYRCYNNSFILTIL
jgi:superfamily II DNA or RNA helicase